DRSFLVKCSFGQSFQLCVLLWDGGGISQRERSNEYRLSSLQTNLPFHSAMRVGITFVRLCPNMKSIRRWISKEARSYVFSSMSRLNQYATSMTCCSCTIRISKMADSSSTSEPIRGVTMWVAGLGDITMICSQERTRETYTVTVTTSGT